LEGGEFGEGGEWEEERKLKNLPRLEILG